MTDDIDTLRAERDAALADADALRVQIIHATTRLMALCHADVPLSLEGAIDAVALDIERMRRGRHHG